jgi:hypothetical protein
MEMKYKNIKNGKIYEVLSWDVTNATNEQDGQQMVLYLGQNIDGKTKVYVRELWEFERKFVKVE